MWGRIGRISFALSCAASSFALLALSVRFGQIIESEVTTAAILWILGIRPENERRSVPQGQRLLSLDDNTVGVPLGWRASVTR